jgi:sacsin
MAPPPAADNFAQKQSITTAIHQICLYYPPNTCLRELLQNADDAGATEVEYVLDTTSYGGEPLLSDGLEDFQGPALLVRNNSVFRDEDFKSLSSISDSVKRKDPAATGKFGQGFNAVSNEPISIVVILQSGEGRLVQASDVHFLPKRSS